MVLLSFCYLRIKAMLQRQAGAVLDASLFCRKLPGGDLPESLRTRERTARGVAA